MKNIERMSLLENIGKHLQDRMTTVDINTYMAGFGIVATEENVSSKRLYVKNLLSSASSDLLAKIADDLDLSVKLDHSNGSPNFWKENNFKLFISHHSSGKERASSLQKVLEQYGICSFVAHED